MAASISALQGTIAESKSLKQIGLGLTAQRKDLRSDDGRAGAGAGMARVRKRVASIGE